jgi:small-conductance mechanosensitive channel
MSIDKAFREAGIEIAFPQRDIHVRSLPNGLPPTPAQPQ